VSTKLLNVVLLVAYDGTDYLGWQDNGQGRAVESELQRVIEQILQQSVVLQASSRTDAGVHAEGQIVNFLSRNPINLETFFIGLNSLLPKDIVVRRVWLAQEGFHPSLHNSGKEYHYHLCTAPVQLPLKRRYEWHFRATLNVDAMKEAAQLLTGTHDFRSFCNMRKGLNYDTFVRTITRLEIFEFPDFCYRFELQGNSFLYKMARNLVGTLVYVGCGKLALADVENILQSQDRRLAGITAPAHGLILKRVKFS
jgi:tRNA pseudouridine38-40 synthase